MSSDKITFFTHSDDNIGVKAPNLDDGWDAGSAKFEIMLPMDGVTMRGTKTVGYMIAATVRFNGGWEFELETPEGVRVRHIEG